MPPISAVESTIAPHTSRNPVRMRENGRGSGISDECGCTLGARFMTGALLVSLVWSGARYDVLTPAFLMRIPLVLAVSLAAAAIGKVIGIVTIRARGRRETERLARAIHRASKHGGRM